MGSGSEIPPQRRRLTVGDLHRMAEGGIFAPDDRVELIDGELIDVPPPGSRHAAAVEVWAARLREAAARRVQIRTQNPVRLAIDSEPQPDIAVVRASEDFYAAAHPGPNDIHLLIEIAGASLAYDLSVKAPLYARSGVPEFWVVDIARNTVTCHRYPADGRYATVQLHRPGELIEVSTLPGVMIRIP